MAKEFWRFRKYGDKTEIGRKMELVEFEVVRSAPPAFRRIRIDAWVDGYLRQFDLDQSVYDPALWFAYEIIGARERIPLHWPSGRPIRGLRRALAVARREAKKELAWERERGGVILFCANMR